MKYDVIPEFLRRKKLTGSADFIEKHRSLMETEFLGSILVYCNLVKNWWERIRAMSDVVYYETLKEQMILSIDAIINAASPAVAICNPLQN